MVAVPKRQRVALNMIVRNEAANLSACLRTAADLFHEVVVADTGSTDGTADIARSFGAKVTLFPWIDHFAAARNAALAQTNAEWVMWLDADDRLEESARQALRRLFARLDGRPKAFAMKVRSGMDPEGRAVRLLDQVRMFPYHPEVRWEYRVHEQILPAFRRLGGGIEWTDVIIDHTGYQDQTLRGKKLQRNLRLLRLDDAERPQDAFTLFNLGWTLLDSGEPREALIRLERSLELVTPDSSILRKLYVLISQACQQLHMPERALAACRQGRFRCPDDLELPFEEALLLKERGDWAGVERSLQQLLAITPGQFFTSVDPELREVRARLLLAEACRRQGRMDEAERHCRAGLAAQPRSVQGWLELAEIRLALGDWLGLEEAARGLEQQAGQPIDAQIVRARGWQMQRNFAAAREILDQVVRAAPDAVGPWLLLSHVLLAEGTDWKAAEHALRRILELQPQHAEAHHNLQVLLDRMNLHAKQGIRT